MPETLKHLVLIHGAWQGAWAFEAWRPRLIQRGWQVHAVDLPGNGWGPDAQAPASLRSYTDHVVALVAKLDGPVVLVGHSGGGLTATQVAEAVPERLAAVVYLAGMMLPSGGSYLEVLNACESEHAGADFRGISSHLLWSADGHLSWVPPDAAREIFLHDCEPVAARSAAALLRAQPEGGRAMRPVWSAERAGRVPRVYVECTDDRSVNIALQRKMQQLTPGAIGITLGCGHVPQLARTEELTERLCPTLEALLSGA